MTEVGAFEAKTHLASLLDRVARGETILITRRGRPVARLVPARASHVEDRRRVAEEIRQMRKGITLGKIRIRDLIDEGRRY